MSVLDGYQARASDPKVETTFGIDLMLASFDKRIVLSGKPGPLFTDVALRVRTMR
ncbi:hypothetical protein [Microvirga sp. G4-2]|uniref:hypothetical protein n=1 Tax=Microvirga sp. G4-2 TaxID=3434467 RepID=UPI0040448FDB